MLNWIVPGNESWVHHYQPESKRASMQWKHPSSPSTKKFKDSQGVPLTHFRKCGENVNSVLYRQVLLQPWNVICRKRPSQLATGVPLHHDNARPHTARATQGRIQELYCDLLEHSSYSLDLVPSTWSTEKNPLVANVSLMSKRLK
jgi:hypothetical protein